MIVVGTALTEKVQELRTEMKSTGLWQKAAPAWVSSFEEEIFQGMTGFLHWLQFVFIPNHQQATCTCLSMAKEKRMIVPSAIKFLGNDIHRGRVLQILIEIDSLTK